MKKIIAMLLVLVMAFALLAGCGNANNNVETPSDEKESGEMQNNTMVEAEKVDTARPTNLTTGERYPKFTMALSADPQSFTPFNPNSGSKDYVYRLIYESLFDCDESNYHPVLAKGYTIVDDYHWDVEIYDYIYDSKGNHIDAHDVVYCYYATLDSGYANKFGMFGSVEATGDYSLRFTWKKPIQGVLELEFVFGNVLIFDKEEYEKGNFATEPVGTGPYTLESFTAASSCVFEARDDYWQKEELVAQGHHSYVQTIEAQIISESAQQVMALENGNIDFSYSVPTENIGDFMDGGVHDEDFSVLRAYNGSGRAYYLYGNMSGNSIMSDKNFRLALWYALDSESIGEASGGVASGGLALCSAKWSTFYDEWSKLDNYMTTIDLELAKDYLSKSAYKGEELILLVENNETYKNMATVIVALLDQIGVKVTLSVNESTTHTSMQLDPDAYDLAITRFGSPNLISSWNKLFNTADFNGKHTAGLNYDPKLPELYAKCNSVDGYNLETMTELMQYVVDNAYVYGFAYDMDSYVYAEHIAEIGFGTNGKPRVNDSIFYMD